MWSSYLEDYQGSIFSLLPHWVPRGSSHRNWSGMMACKALLRDLQDNGQVTIVAIIGTTILVPYFPVKSLHLTWGTHKWNLKRVPNLLMNARGPHLTWEKTVHVKSMAPSGSTGLSEQLLTKLHYAIWHHLSNQILLECTQLMDQ